MKKISWSLSINRQLHYSYDGRRA